MSKLSAPVAVVLLELPGQDGLTEYTVQTDNRDAIQWDVTRGRRGWPKFDEAPMLYMTFLAWHAMRRSGALPVIDGEAMTLDVFMARAVEIRAQNKAGDAVPLDEATEADLMVDPTLKDHAPV